MSRVLARLFGRKKEGRMEKLHSRKVCINQWGELDPVIEPALWRAIREAGIGEGQKIDPFQRYKLLSAIKVQVSRACSYDFIFRLFAHPELSDPSFRVPDDMVVGDMVLCAIFNFSGDREEVHDHLYIWNILEDGLYRWRPIAYNPTLDPRMETKMGL